MGFAERLARKAAADAAAAANSAGQRVRAAQRALADAAAGVGPGQAAGQSISAGVQQAALGRLPGSGDPASAVSAEAAWDRAARNPGLQGPVGRVRSAPVAEQVADDLEQALLEAMDIRADADGVLGVNEQVFADLERRLKVIGGGGAVERAAVQVLARRYGVPAGASLEEAATTISEGLAGQRMSLYQDEPNVIDSRLQRISDEPFPERPTSLEGFPAADERFDPVEVEELVRIPRFEYDQLGRLKVDGDGNPLPRIDPETGLPTYEPLLRRRLVPQRTVDGVSAVLPSGEFTTIGRRRSGSDGNRSAEEVAFVLDRGDGTYQLSRVAESGNYDNQIVDEGQLGRLLVESGYERIAGPELSFSVTAPTEGEAESLGRMLAQAVQAAPLPGSPDRMAFGALGRELRVPGTKNQPPEFSFAPGSATAEQVAEIVRQIDGLGDLFGGALKERALRAAGFRQPGNELEFGSRLLEQARALADAEPAVPAAAAPAPLPPASPTTSLEVRPPRSSAARGSGSVDVAGASVRRARDMSAGQPLMTPAQREAQQASEGFVSGPTAGQVEMVSGPAAATTFLGPDGQPLTATFDPAAMFSDAAPPLFPPAGPIRPGIMSGLQQYGIPADGPGSSSVSMGGVFGDGTVMDTGTLPGSVPVTMDASLSMPDRLDVLQGLSDVATPATPVLNFDFSGDWSRAAGRGSAVDATWRNKDYDQPVRVTGLAGELDGVRYYTIEGSGTAIPEPELDFGGSTPPGATRSGPTVAGTVDVGGVDFARAVDPDSADAARQQFAELANREAATKAALNTFADEPTDDVVQIWRRMEELQAFEPAFAALDVTEQFELARMTREQLQELADDLSLEISETPNPNTFTQSQSVASPTGGSQFSTAQDLPPVVLNRADRVRRARDPAAPQATDSASDIAFGMNPSRRPPSNRRALEQRAASIEAQAEVARRIERILYDAAKMYSPPPLRAGEAPPLASTPDQVVASVRGHGDFFRLSDSERRAVLDAAATPAGVNALLDSTVSRQQALRKELRALGNPPTRDAGADYAEPDFADAPDNVTDIPQARDEAQAELDESAANAQFYNEQRANAGVQRALPLRRAQDIVRRALGIKGRDRLPLAFRDYDSRFGRRISDTDIQRLNDARGRIVKYTSMTDGDYQALRARNTDLPASRQAHVNQLEKEWKSLARLVSSDTVQDAGSTGENQARLIQNLLSDNPQTRLQALRELFSVAGVRNAAGERAGEDGLQVLRMLANDPAYGSVENVLYDVLNRDQSIRNPELSRAPVVDESGASLVDRQRDESFVVDEDDVRRRNTDTGVPPAAGLGPESLREVSRRLAEDIGPAEGRRLTQAELQEAGLEPTFFPDEGPAVRPSFIDRLRGYLPFLRRQADEAPAGPQVVTRQGLDTAEQEIAAATTPEEMNAILARINSVREQALARLDDTNDPPVADGDGVERSARQQINDRADALTATWRRRMERMQAAAAEPAPGAGADTPPVYDAAESPSTADAGPAADADRDAFTSAYGEAVEAGGDMPAAIRAGRAAAARSGEARMANLANYTFVTQRARAEDAPALDALQRENVRLSSMSDAEYAQLRGSQPGLPATRAERLEQIKRELRDTATSQENLLNMGVEVRAQRLAAIDARIAQLEQDALAGRPSSTGDEASTPASLQTLRQERARVASTKVTRLPDGRVEIQLADNTPPIIGELRPPVETEAGLEPPTFEASLTGVDFGPDGTPSLRRQGNVRDRRGVTPSFDPPPALAAAGAPSAASRADQEILEDFSRPVRQEEPLAEPLPYDADELNSNIDEERISADVEASLREPSPGPGRRKATEEYEAEQARKADKRGGEKGQKASASGKKSALRRVAQAGGLVAAGTVLRPLGVGIGLDGLAGTAGGLGYASAAYGGEGAPSGVAGDINTAGEPAGSQVRRARRLSYLTTQNPLPR